VLRLLLILFAFIISSGAFANNLNMMEVAGDHYEKQSFPVHIYTDYSKKLTIDDISKLDLSQNNSLSRFDIPVERANYWFIFQMYNQSGHDIDRIVKFDEAFLNQADIYYSVGDDKLTTSEWLHEKNGLVVPVEEREINNRLPSFKVPLKAGETKTIYLMMNTELNLLTVGIVIKSPHSDATAEQLEIAAYWLFFGMSLAMLIYNLFLLVALRDTLYLYYVLYCSALLVFILMYSGFDLYFIRSGYWHYLLIVSISISLAFLLQFVRKLLRTKKNLPRIDLILKCLITLFTLQTLLTIFDINYAYLAAYIAMFSTLFLLLVNVIAYWKKIPLANYALFGLSWYVLGLFINAGVNSGFVPFNLFTRYGFMIGSLIELFVFSLALAYRIHHLQISKTKMQLNLYLSESKAKKELEITVKSRTAELIAVNKKLEHLSQEDGLTGLFNRRYFDYSITKEWDRMKRKQTPLCLILADIDFFKQFNDIYGHQQGDHCLRLCADIIKKSTTRSADTSARYGGEEFVILLPDSKAEDGWEVANKIKRYLQEKQISHSHNEGGMVTMSFGIAAVIPNDNSSIEQFIEAADVALYKSKNNGRNRITIDPNAV